MVEGGVPSEGPILGHFWPFWGHFDHFWAPGGSFWSFWGWGGVPPPGGGIFVHFGVKKWHTKAPPLVVQLFGHFHRGFLRTVFGGWPGQGVIFWPGGVFFDLLGGGTPPRRGGSLRGGVPPPGGVPFGVIFDHFGVGGVHFDPRIGFRLLQNTCFWGFLGVIETPWRGRPPPVRLWQKKSKKWSFYQGFKDISTQKLIHLWSNYSLYPIYI